MAMFYPRRQTVFIFMISAIAVGATAYYVHIDDRSTETTDKTSAVVAVSASPTPIQNIVTTEDWKKQFIDKSTGSFQTVKTVATTATKEQLTATDILSRQFMTKYMQMQKAGLVTDQQTISDVTNQLVASSMSSIQTPKPYVMANIRVTKAVDDASLRSYFSTVNNILTTYIPDQDHNEAVIATKALDQNDMTILKNIDPIIVNYESGIKALLATPVPGPLAQYHLSLMNGMQVALFNARSFRHIDTDPVKGMAAINLEISSLQAMDDALSGIKGYLTTAGIPVS